MTIKEQREAVIREALSWEGTPYHHMGRVKGAGADCATFLAAPFEALGLVPKVEIGYYPNDWHMHHTEELYLLHLKRYVYEVDSPLPGDIALFRYGLTAAHGVIVIDWPNVIIHSALNQGVRRSNPQVMLSRLAGFFRPNFWKEVDE